ncbi:MAG: hypothetical protein SGJ16_05625 [Nitrospirota bacterium]|nr:hypothetical protein [Nitrospirota bacterium]
MVCEDTARDQLTQHLPRVWDESPQPVLHAVILPVLAQGFRLIRKELGLAKKKTMVGQHERRRLLVEERGGVPRRGVTECWEDIQRAWNKAVPKDAHS